LSHNDPNFDSTFNTDEYQRIFPGGEGGRCLELTPYNLQVPIIWKSWSLNLLETSGSVQASTGINITFSFLLQAESNPGP